MSGLEIAGFLKELVGIGVQIYDAVQLVRSFKCQSKTLQRRVEVILAPVRALHGEIEADRIEVPAGETGVHGTSAGVGLDGESVTYQRPLQDLEGCMKDIESFLVKLGNKHWLKKFAFKNKIQEQFDGYNNQLTTLQQSLGLCLQVAFPNVITKKMKEEMAAAFDKDEMARQRMEDLKGDLESIKADLEELKESDESQREGIEEIKESLTMLYEIVKESFECLNRDIQFSNQLKEDEDYTRELRMNYREFTDFETLQEGTYGPIIKTKHNYEDKLLVMKTFEDSGKSSVDVLKGQLNLWKNLKYSRFIVQLYGYTTDLEGRMCFVVEYMHLGTLRSVLHDKSKELPWDQRLTLAKDCANGLYAIHFGQGLKIMLHRAVTSTRFLVDERYRAKISDNGFVKSASKISKSKSTLEAGGIGSVERDEINYMCPEEARSDFKRSVKSEVYKFGMILYEIASRMMPFEARGKELGHPVTDEEKMDFIIEGQTEAPPDDTPPQFKEVIQRCRATAPERRPATHEVLNMLNRIQNLSPVN